MRVRVRLFASAAEACGGRELEVELPDGATAGQLLSALAGSGGPLLLRCTVAVRRQAVGPQAALPPEAEIAVLPPVSGGSPAFRVGPEPISADAILAEVAGPGLGGQVLFLGTVRGTTDGADTTGLDYEAYPEMALAVLEAVARRCAELWPGAHLAVWHRTGHLEPGQVAVAVAAAAAHRADAFAAARLAIERVKAELPIWKKEWSPDGQSRWVDHA